MGVASKAKRCAYCKSTGHSIQECPDTVGSVKNKDIAIGGKRRELRIWHCSNESLEPEVNLPLIRYPCPLCRLPVFPERPAKLFVIPLDWLTCD